MALTDVKFDAEGRPIVQRKAKEEKLWKFDLDTIVEMASQIDPIDPESAFPYIPFSKYIPQDAEGASFDQYDEIFGLWDRFFAEKSTQTDIERLLQLVGSSFVIFAVKNFADLKTQWIEKWYQDVNTYQKGEPAKVVNQISAAIPVSESDNLAKVSVEDQREYNGLVVEAEREYRTAVSNSSERAVKIGVENASRYISQFVRMINDSNYRDPEVIKDIIHQIALKAKDDFAKARAVERNPFNRVDFMTAFIDSEVFGIPTRSRILKVLLDPHSEVLFTRG